MSINTFAGALGLSTSIYNAFKVESAWTYAASDTTTEYSDTGSGGFVTWRKYEYGTPAHGQMTKLTELNSDLSQRITYLTRTPRTT